MTRIVHNSRRSRTSCSVIALATVLAVGATPAAAQSFQGTGSFATNGTGASIGTGAGTTTINLNTGNTVINWTPTDNAINNNVAINFQNSGTTATFTTANTGGGNFSVLNNINVADPSRVISMNGTVNGSVNGKAGGNIYFYSPSGFLIGNSAVFNLQSLVLSASPITNTEFAKVGSTGYGTVQFGQAPNPNATITMNGDVNAFVPPPIGVPLPGDIGYVAMIAPKVVQGSASTITADGSVALVGAEAATITFSADMLFNIQVDVGTTSSSGVEVYGDITGPAADVGDQQRIMLVAVPKNDALTMIIGGGADLGFQLAGAATDDNGVIVLSAGHDISAGDIGSVSAASGAPANFWFTGAHATSDLIGEATGYADLYSTDGQASQLVTTFDSDVIVHADDHVWMNASGTGTFLTVGGNLNLSTNQYGEFSGESATGGDTQLYALNGGSLTVGGNAILSADGYGGSTESSGAAGGIGTGGKVAITGSNGGSVTISGDMTATADGYGGDSYSGNGGAGFGGTQVNGGGATVLANSGTLTFDGDLNVSASGFGGQAYSSGTTSGAGTGGEVQVSALSGGDISVVGSTSVNAEGRGGITWDNGANGGDGTGGSINNYISGAGSSLLLAGGIFSANGEGGGPGEGTCCVAIGGDGFGGVVSISGNSGGLLQSTGTIELSAAGSGGYGSLAGGSGFGGVHEDDNGVWVDAQTGLTINITGELALDATGSGGDSDGQAGNGTGGYSALYMQGGSVTATAEVNVDADGFGGESLAGGNGGNGTGGYAEVVGSVTSSLNAGQRLLVEADGTGGDSTNEGSLGNGGTGTGGVAGVFGNGGTLTINGNVEVSAYGQGGEASGGIGGNGTGRNAEVDAFNGSSVVINGNAMVDASGYGGNGHIGGNGTGGGQLFDDGSWADGAIIFASNASITFGGDVSVSSSGTGGNGADGGDGGDGSGGLARIQSHNNDLGPSSISVNEVESTTSVVAEGHGGAGGQGASGNTGGDGGNGGDGFGGSAAIFATAGNGHVDINYASLSVQAFGGAGGDGGNGDAGAGGSGGSGGNATGGGINVGTASGSGQAAGSNLGVATFGGIYADSSATGGQGGDGNSGATDGNGGAGGEADGGNSVLLVRGSTVNANGTTTLVSNGTGGDGGLGGGITGVGGDGGDGFAGEVGVLSSARYLIPAQRGTLNAGDIVGTAAGIGGNAASGGTDGTGIVEGGSNFDIDSSTVNIGSLTFNVSGDVVAPGSDPSRISITGSSPVTVGNFEHSTIGDMSLYVVNSVFTVTDTLTLSAANFIVDPDKPAATGVGLIDAGTVLITTDEDFVADANWDVTNTFVVDAPGLIALDDIHDDNGIDFSAGESISLGALDAGTYVDLRANGPISTGTIDAGTSVFGRTLGSFTSGDIDAGTFIDIRSAGAMALGNLVAGDYVDLRSNGAISVLYVVSGETIRFATDGGTLSTGDLTAGDSVLGQAVGAINVGSVSAGIVNPSAAPGAAYRVSFASEDNITTQAIDAAGTIGFGTPEDLVTGNLDSGAGIMALVGGDISLPTVNAGDYVFLADYSMSELGGDFDTFDRSAVLAAPPVLTGGSIGISGPLTAGTFVVAAAGTSLTATTIEATAGYMSLLSGGSISTGALQAGGDIDLDAAGNISFASANAGGQFDFDAGGSLTGGNVVAGQEIGGDAGGTVTLQNLTAGLSLENDFSVGISAIGNISVGNVTGTGPVGFATQANLTTGTINAGDVFLAMVGGNMSSGAITTSGVDGGQVYIGDDSMFTDAGGTWDGEGDFQPELVLAQNPVRTGGSITINGTVSTGSFRAAAGTSLTVGNLDIDSGLSLDAGGALTTGDLVVGDFVLANGGSITTGDIDAFSVDMTSTAGNISTDNITAFGAVVMDAAGDIGTGDITAGSIDLLAGDDITTGDLTTQQVLALVEGPITTLLEPGASITLNSGGDISTGNLDSYDGVYAEAGGNIHTLNIDANTFVKLYGGGNGAGNIDADNINAGAQVLIAAPGTITTADILAGGIFMAFGHGDMSYGDVTASEVFLADYAMLTSGGVSFSCVGNCGTLGANGVVIAPPSGTTYSYVSTDGGEAGAGQLPGAGGTDGSLYTTSTFTAEAGDAVEFWFNYVTSDGSTFNDYAWAALLTSDLDPVAILFTARTQETGTIIPGQGLPGVEATLDPNSVPIIPNETTWDPLGGDSGSCYAAGCGYTGWVNSTYEIADSGSYVLQFGVTNWSDSAYASGMAFSGITVGGDAVSGALVPTGGSISIGNVSTGKMSAAAGTTLTAGNIDSTGSIDLISGGNLSFASADAGTYIDLDSGGGITGGAVTADSIVANAGGTATLNGIWSSGGNVDLTSNNIDIGGSGGIDAVGVITLVSTNGTQTVIGDGVTTSGYLLSNAEFGRISGDSIHIAGRGDASATIDMIVGDLSVTGPLSGGNSNITGAEGNLVFAVGDVDTMTPGGVIRVVGDVNATGFSNSNAMEFYATRFELDAERGSVSLTSSGGTLAGELGLYADRIHVAQDSILNALASNPTYTGYQQDLNLAATTQRPEGVLRADTLWIESDNLQDVLIQNTGTYGPGASPAGFLVREAYVNEDFLTAGPAGSINLVVNGQLVTEGGTLTGVAVRDALVPEGTDITPFTANSTINGCPLTGECIIKPPAPPTPNVVDSQIDLINGDALGDSDFGNEDSIDDNEEGDEGKSNPISPPQPLFDTRPLIPGGDVNDPVSGTGNPALLGGDAQCEADENGQCPNPVEGDSQ